MENKWVEIRDWLNRIVSFHQQHITKDTLEQLKYTLFSHREKQYYTFKSNEQGFIVISFSLGEVVIKQQQGKLIIDINEETKRNVYELKEVEQERELMKNLPTKDESFESLVRFSEETF